MGSENAIEVSNLTKYYGKLLAVDNINFNVKKGEIFGFLARARLRLYKPWHTHCHSHIQWMRYVKRWVAP